MSNLKKLIVAGFIILLLFLAGAYYGTGYVIYNMLTAVEPRCERVWMEGKRDNTPSLFYSRYNNEDELIEMPQYAMPSYEDVNFPPRDEDLRLSAWYIPAPQESEHVVIIVHGIHSCKQDPTVLLPAGMLHHGGFNVLIVELRNHGDSEIEDGRNAVGNREYHDVLGAFDYLLEQGFEAENIGLAGISFGGGTATIAFGQEPDIPALWLDSAIGNIADLLDYELERNNIPPIFASAIIQIGQLSGVPLNVLSPDEEITRHNGRPIAIIHGTADERVPFRFGEQLYENAGDNAIFIPVEGMRHVEAMYAESDFYERELNAFFTDALVERE